MPTDRLEDIFAEAIEITAHHDRRRFLDEVCEDDSEMRMELLGLIRAHEQAGDFMEEDVSEDETWNELPEDAIGPYTLVDQLGSGGFGVVYRALQVAPVRREVALKVIKPGMDTREVIARFDAERQALAMMDHPAIARVLGAGSTVKGHPYFVMELFEGEPITSFCDNRQLDVRQRLALFAEVCDAVQHAHQKGIIHRDLKPSNILVADSADKPVVKVIDFGVAKALSESLTEQTLITLQGQPLGTPRYMSPEQFEESASVDTRSDVYSLGVVLYELLTGTTPLRRERLRDYSPEQLRRAITDDDPDVPSQRIRVVDGDSTGRTSTRQLDARRLSSLIKGDLDWLIMKALDKDPGRRYPTTSALADDVRRYLKHEPVDAGPPRHLYRLSKLARRNRPALAMVTLVFASLFGGASLATWNSWRAARAERLAEQRLAVVESEQRKTRQALALAESAESEQRRLRALAEERERQSRQLLYASDVRLADQAYAEGDIRAFVDLLERQRPDSAREDMRGFEWWLLRNQATMEPTSITDHQSGVSLARFTSDRRFLVTGHYDGKLHLWDAETFNHVRTLTGHDSFANGIDLDAQGKTLVSAGNDHQIRLWDLHSGQQVDSVVADTGHVHRVFFWDRAQKLISSGEAPEVKIWNRSPLEVIERYSGFETAEHHGIKNRLDLSPDRRFCVAADQYQTARVYDLQTGEVRCSLDLSVGQYIRCLRYSPDGRWIAGGRYTQEVTLWDAATGEVVDRFEGHLDDVQDLAFHPNGELLATSDKSGIVRTWPLSQENVQPTDDSGTYQNWPCFFVAHDDRIFSLDFSPDGDTLVTACRDGTVRRWKAQTMPRFATGETLLEPQAAWMNETTLAVTNDKRLVFWELVQGERMASHSFEEPIQSLAVSTGDVSTGKVSTGKVSTGNVSTGKQWLATGHFDGKLRIWNGATGEVEETFDQHEGTIHSLAFSSWDGTLISAGDDGSLLQWDIAEGTSTLLKRFPHHCKAVRASPSGPWVAAAVQDDIYLFRLDDPSPPKRLRGHLNSADCLAFSPDGKWLASGSDDRTVRLWEVESGLPKHVIREHRNKIEAIAFSPDGQTVASGDKSALVSFSHVETGRLLCSINLLHYWNDLDISSENPWVSDLKFSRDGTRLAASLFRNGYLVLRGFTPNAATNLVENEPNNP